MNIRLVGYAFSGLTPPRPAFTIDEEYLSAIRKADDVNLAIVEIRRISDQNRIVVDRQELATSVLGFVFSFFLASGIIFLSSITADVPNIVTIPLYLLIVVFFNTLNSRRIWLRDTPKQRTYIRSIIPFYFLLRALEILAAIFALSFVIALLDFGAYGNPALSQLFDAVDQVSSWLVKLPDGECAKTPIMRILGAAGFYVLKRASASGIKSLVPKPAS